MSDGATRLTGVHVLLCYACNLECDHCFLHCGPHAPGTFTRAELQRLLRSITELESVRSVYFEGGEPFLFHPLLVEAVRMARGMGLRVGIVTNAYWATTEEDAELWLRPLRDLGIQDLSLSDDAFHQGGAPVNTARVAHRAAQRLGLPVHAICVEPPPENPLSPADRTRSIDDGSLRFRGRAAEKLTGGLPCRPLEELRSCPFEELESPERVHVDSYGNVQICQGICIGNMWRRPFAALMSEYVPERHPICGPLLDGGPAELARSHGLRDDDASYVDACHACYAIRKALIDRFPQHLAPRQVYGLGEA